MDTACYKCSKSLTFEDGVRLLRSEECPHCGASLHCCKMCIFFDTSAYNDCRESMAERVVEKDKANFCDYFQCGVGDSSEKNRKENLVSAADSLFKKQ